MTWVVSVVVLLFTSCALALPQLGTQGDTTYASIVIDRADGKIYVDNGYAIRTNSSGIIVQWTKLDCPSSLVNVRGQSLYCADSLLLGDMPTPTPAP